MMLADALAARRSGNLDLLRLMAAMAVVVSHAWPLALGPGAQEPLEALTGRSLGAWAVLLFFFLSGLLIVQSAERRSARAFWLARVRRILPGLTVALLVTVAMAVACGATPDGAEAVRYVVRGLSLFGVEHEITGAFAWNPYPLAVNGPLWSLQYEVAAYAICFAASRWARGAVVVLAVAVALMMMPGLPGRVATFAPLLFAFALGMVAWRMRGWIALTVPVLAVLVAIAVVTQSAPLGTLAFCHAVLLAAYRFAVREMPVDLSFGVYIYGWPVAQALMAVEPGLTPVALAGATVLCTLPLAWASWTLIERPALPMRRALA